MKVSPLQNNFSSGEMTPYMSGRVDMDRYKNGLAVCLNYLPLIQGGVTSRPGTRFVKEVKDSSKKVRLIRFEFSTTQAYMLEFGEQYIRFYKDNAIILDGNGDPYELETLYQESQLADLNFTQSADVLYVVHPSHPPRKFLRRGHADWLQQPMIFFDGPYMPVNTTTTTLTPTSATTGTGVTITTGPSKSISAVANDGTGLIQITATAHGRATGDRVYISGVGGVAAANGAWNVTTVDDNNFTLDGSVFSGTYTSGGTVVPGVFKSTDLGRLIRIQEGTTWGIFRISQFNNEGSVTGEVRAPLTNTNAKTVWRLGGISQTTGYPACIVFHEDRLWLTGYPNAPQRVDGSKTGDYENMQPTEFNGTVASDNAVSFTLNSNDVNAARWMLSDEKGLLIGSMAGEWVIKSASTQEAISPTSITAIRASSWGSRNVAPVQVGKSAIFVQRAGKKVYEYNYFYDVDGFKSTDLTVLSEHISGTGITQLSYQKEPLSIVWAIREDGILACLGYSRDSDALRVGWSRQQIAGVSDAAGTQAVVESISSIPSADGKRDDLWLVVRRRINGQTKRYIEYLTKIFDASMEIKDSFFVDSGLTYDDPKAITNISAANPAVVTSANHGFTEGNTVIISDVNGAGELEENKYSIVNTTTNTFELVGVDGSTLTPYVSGGYARKLVSNIAGLDHLEGQEVAILADGSIREKRTVVSGAITLSSPGGIVHVGLGYNQDGQLPRLEAGAADGTSIGKTRRTNQIGILLHRSLNLLIGPSFSDLSRIEFRDAAGKMDHGPDLFSGIVRDTFAADYDFENQITFRQDQPLPSTILAFLPQLTTQDR